MICYLFMYVTFLAELLLCTAYINAMCMAHGLLLTYTYLSDWVFSWSNLLYFCVDAHARNGRVYTPSGYLTPMPFQLRRHIQSISIIHIVLAVILRSCAYQKL